MLVVYYLGKVGDFQVCWMKTCNEIKHMLKSSLKASFPALKGNCSEKRGGFLFCSILCLIFLSSMFLFTFFVINSSSVHCIKTFSRRAVQHTTNSEFDGLSSLRKKNKDK